MLANLGQGENEIWRLGAENENFNFTGRTLRAGNETQGF
jgi:hypothetical protein